jgi:formamidopyrimidine-DNA glycosylase
VPELIEIEAFRRLAEGAVGRRIVTVDAPDAWFLKGGLTAAAIGSALTGRRITSARRIGKLLLLDTDGGPTLGLRFGMTGRLLLDGAFGLERLNYGSNRDERAWDRFALHFDDGGEMTMRDPRRLGGVLLDPDEARLGVEATVIRPAELRAALAKSRAPLKARLMDQSRLAGLGNLLTDELLWRAGLDPARQAGSLTPAEHRRLHRYLGRVLRELSDQGGSHTGLLQDARFPGSVCPKDGTPLLRRTIGGRTTYSCPRHQR